jgi:CRP-like cAMP-binding protein
MNDNSSEKNKFIIYPDSKFNTYWETFILLLTIIVGIQAPLVIVFNIKSAGIMLGFDIFVSIAFGIDIIINFITAYEERKSIQDIKLITNHGLIAKKYMKGWFWVDFFATIPFDVLFSGVTVFSIGRLGRMLRIFRLARLFRLIRIAQTMQRINKSNIFNPSILRMVFLMFWIAFAAHFITSGWIFLTEGEEPELGNGSRYLKSLYWSITTLTTIGYGDITPQTNPQIIYVIFIEITGAALYGFIIGNIANLITNIDISKNQYSERMEKINTFMKYRNIPFVLQERINNYYTYLWESRRGYDERSVLKDLPVSLKTQVSLFLNKDIIEKVPIFKGASPAFIKEIILNLEPVVFTPNDIIVAKGELGYDMFFISSGSVDVVSEDESIVYATLTTGQFFGEIAILFSSERTATIKAKEYCDMYRLEKETFDHVLERYPEFEKQIKELADKRKAEIQGNNTDEKNTDSADLDLSYLKIQNIKTEIVDNTIHISWDNVESQCHYEVIKKQNDKKWRIIEANLVEPQFVDNNPDLERKNIYRIRAIDVRSPGAWSKSISVKV